VALRVLVVDDYEPVRRVVRLILEVRDDLQIVGEASDGLEAVQKAQELRPDLILLDIDLPRLNGIQAARRLRDLVPRAKVLFLSVESSSDVVREALNVGAVGYIYKLHTASELLPAIEMVLSGKQFVSSHLGPFATNAIRDEHFGDRPSQELLAPPRRRSHEVGVYRDDASFVDDFTRFIEDTLKLENPVIVIVNESHRNSLFQRLQAHGWDICAAIQKGSYISLDVSDTLSKFMVNDWPDSALFAKVVGDLIEGAAKAEGRHPRVAACGECAPALWAQGKAEAAIQVGHLWDEIADSHDVDTLCGYVGSRPPSKEETQGSNKSF
jgi:DNA-binding NarL/FixJ family response regulator